MLCAVLCALASAAWAGVREIRSFVLTVSDIDRAAAFYESALHFKRIADRVIVDQDYDYLTGVFAARVRNVTLRLGDETIELEQYLAPAGETIPIGGRAHDLWFQHMAIVVTDMQRAYEHVTKHRVRSISSEPQTIPPENVAAAGIKAFKFRDPDGHPLELLEFPGDKGSAKWRDGKLRRGDTLFLGIDHSAITVADTERSASFYRDLLGLSIAGQSLNTGETQARLDGAFGAVVRVTGLRPASPHGPGLEFLQYLAPGDGRPAPAIMRTNDLLHMRVVLEVADLAALLPKLEARKVRFVSPRIVDLRGMPYRKGLMVKDPDGHAVLLVQP
jgi:catechol 2,3-dioxygenase-like lactoylglutathione lyase family enzyme